MNSTMPRFIPVMSGRACAGFLVSRGLRGIEAYDRDERSIGVFADVMAAALAVEESVASACSGCGGK
jgi:hypothetical protein